MILSRRLQLDLGSRKSSLRSSNLGGLTEGLGTAESGLRYPVRPTPSTRVLLDLLDQSKMAVAIFDSEGRCVHFSAAMAYMLQEKLDVCCQTTIWEVAACMQASCALDMLADESEESPTAQMPIQQALGSIDRVAQGVREAAETFLSSSRSESSMSFSEVVNEVMNTRTPGEFARIRMDYGKMQQLPSAFGSTIQIRKAVQQVLSNALEAQPDGMVTVDGCVIETEELRFLSSGEVVQPGTYLVLEISDEGPGLSDEVRQKATLPFYSTKLLGRGLGLATAAKIARDHGGGVDMSTNVGGKTTVRLWLALGPDCANPAR